jgi:hypothetical protein
MAQYGRNRKWRGDYYRRNRNWDRYPRSYGKYQKHSFRWMLRDFLIRLVAFTIVAALGLAWVKFHFLGGMFQASF